MKVLTFLAAHYEFVAAAFLAVSFCIFLIHTGWNWHENADKAKSAKQEQVKNEIRNRPHSSDVVNARWLRGTF